MQRMHQRFPDCENVFCFCKGNMHFRWIAQFREVHESKLASRGYTLYSMGMSELRSQVRAGYFITGAPGNCRLCAGTIPDPIRPILFARSHSPGAPGPWCRQGPGIGIGSAAKILSAGQVPGRKVQESGIPFDDAGLTDLYRRPDADWVGPEGRDGTGAPPTTAAR